MEKRKKKVEKKYQFQRNKEINLKLQTLDYEAYMPNAIDKSKWTRKQIADILDH